MAADGAVWGRVPIMRLAARPSGSERAVASLVRSPARRTFNQWTMLHPGASWSRDTPEQTSRAGRSSKDFRKGLCGLPCQTLPRRYDRLTVGLDVLKVCPCAGHVGFLESDVDDVRDRRCQNRRRIQGFIGRLVRCARVVRGGDRPCPGGDVCRVRMLLRDMTPRVAFGDPIGAGAGDAALGDGGALSFGDASTAGVVSGRGLATTFARNDAGRPRDIKLGFVPMVDMICIS